MLAGSWAGEGGGGEATHLRPWGQWESQNHPSGSRFPKGIVVFSSCFWLKVLGAEPSKFLSLQYLLQAPHKQPALLPGLAGDSVEALALISPEFPTEGRKMDALGFVFLLVCLERRSSAKARCCRGGYLHCVSSAQISISSAYGTAAQSKYLPFFNLCPCRKGPEHAYRFLCCT